MTCGDEHYNIWQWIAQIATIGFAVFIRWGIEEAKKLKP
jgi:hypothetical protein